MEKHSFLSNHHHHHLTHPYCLHIWWCNFFHAIIALHSPFCLRVNDPPFTFPSFLHSLPCCRCPILPSHHCALSHCLATMPCPIVLPPHPISPPCHHALSCSASHPHYALSSHLYCPSQRSAINHFQSQAASLPCIFRP